MKKHILFVDDEPNVLQGLQRMLRPMRHTWDMHFAGGGQEALTLLEQTTFDVVVSDLSMPGMDGVQLLTHITARYPHTVRIILSGYADGEMMRRAVGLAHQYLSKPCEAARLQEIVTRICLLP